MSRAEPSHSKVALKLLTVAFIDRACLWLVPVANACMIDKLYRNCRDTANGLAAGTGLRRKACFQCHGAGFGIRVLLP